MLVTCCHSDDFTLSIVGVAQEYFDCILVERLHSSLLDWVEVRMKCFIGQVKRGRDLFGGKPRV